MSARLEIYRGKRAIRLVGTAGDDVVDKLLVIPRQLQDGTIELDVAAFPEPGQSADARSYVGIAFRGTTDWSRFQALYVRPENARALDQLRRNRSTQYIAFPDRPWQKLRSEAPGRYESYVDLEPRRWSNLRIEISGATARLFVDRAAQPALVVTDLASSGGDSIALWIGNRTTAYFASISVRAQPRPVRPAATP